MPIDITLILEILVLIVISITFLTILSSFKLSLNYIYIAIIVY